MRIWQARYKEEMQPRIDTKQEEEEMQPRTKERHEPVLRNIFVTYWIFVITGINFIHRLYGVKVIEINRRFCE